jgi:putative redox protein
MILTASARRDGATLRHTVNVNGRHTIITDEPAGLGGSDTGPAPHELLAATLAACIATMIALYAQRRAWDIGEPRVDVAYDTEATPRRFDVTVHLPEHLSAEQLKRLERVADTCPVRRALEDGFEFCERVELGPVRVEPGPVVA